MDEFGNAHLDLSKQGTFSHFVYTAIVIEKSNIELANQKRKEISQKYFQNQPIKSSSISNDEKGFNKRLQALKLLKEVNFVVFALVVDKSKIKAEGLTYKDVFYKYFNKIFLKQFAENFNRFNIYADQLGYPEFRSSLRKYIYDHVIQRDLFNPDRHYQLVEDKAEEPLVQLADLISGCLGKIYCSSHLHPSSQELFELLHDRLFIDFFPYERIYFEGYTPGEAQPSTDVSRIALEEAVIFINSNDKTVSLEALEVLKYLVLMFKSFPDKLIETYEIVSRVQFLSPHYSDATLRQDIQALRDKGLLIVSISGKSGYKIPNKIEDMVGFYNRYLGMIIPMLNRIKISHQTLQLKSLNDINLLNKEYNLDILNELIKVVDRLKNHTKL